MNKCTPKSYRHIVLGGALAVLTASLTLPLVANAQSSTQPNIVFIIADDVNRELFNSSRGIEPVVGLSPNIDALASEGFIFPNQHCVSPACTPSRFNVLTGTYGSRDRDNVPDTINAKDMAIVGWNTHVLADDISFPRLMQANGYRTGFAGKDHVAEKPPGYDDSIPDLGDPADPTIKARLIANQDKARITVKAMGFDYAESIYRNNPVALSPKVLAIHNNEWITKGALDFIDDCATNYSTKPFLLYFSTTMTHAPYQSYNSWDAPRTNTPIGYLDTPMNILPSGTEISSRMATAVSSGKVSSEYRYAKHFLHLDDAVGAVMDKLEEHNLDENTLVIFFNDHGVNEGKSSSYECGTLTYSLIWKKGGFPGGHHSDALLSNVDFAPTILDLIGIEVPFDTFDGKSFRPILDGTASKTREHVYFEMGCARGILMGDWKYIAVRYPDSISNPDGYGQVSLKNPPSSLEIRAIAAHPNYFSDEQLYNLADDPNEQVNLASNPEYADIFADLQSRLVEYINPLPGGFDELKTTNDELKPGSLIKIY